jgi:hypothetical protein
VALTPFLLPYWHAFHDQGMARSELDVIGFAASWKDYLTTPGRIHYALWGQYFFDATALFPGVLGVLLTVSAIVSGRAWRDRRARMCLAFGVAGIALSFGGRLPGYILLFRLVPLLRGVRAVSRYGYLGIVAVAMLAGFGAADLLKRMTSASMRSAAAACAIAIAAIEPFCAPIWFARYTGISPIYSRLRDVPDAVVAELPFYSTTASFRHAPYMLNSTAHWKPMLNGYSGFEPPSFEIHYAELEGFPDPPSIAALRRAGVTHIFVHENQVGGRAVVALEASGAVRRLASDGDIILYQLEK